MRLPLSDEQAKSLEIWVTIEGHGAIESASILDDNPDHLLGNYKTLDPYVRLVEGLRAGDVPHDTIDIGVVVAAEWVSNYDSGVGYAKRCIEQVREGDPLVLEGKSKEDRERFYREEEASEAACAKAASAVHDILLNALASKEVV